MDRALDLARKFHDTYERLAPSFGYETRADTKQFDPESPNGRLMVAVCAALSAEPEPPAAMPGEGVERFQAKVQPWMMACFGEMIAGDREERNHRFLEEALELVQSLGCEASEVRQLVDYVYGRPIGHPPQEVGGVMVTLAALCLANDLNMHSAGWVELDRIWGKVETIRAKQAAKPKHSPLPAIPPESAESERVRELLTEARYRLSLTEDCLDCNLDDERQWKATICFLEEMGAKYVGR